MELRSALLLPILTCLSPVPYEKSRALTFFPLPSQNKAEERDSEKHLTKRCKYPLMEGVVCSSKNQHLIATLHNPLDLIERDFIVRVLIESRHPWWLVMIPDEEALVC